LKRLSIYIQKLPYVDSEKIAIWGWSYGGYLTSKVVEADSGIFKVAMAVAPVTDWRLYDTLYTERYMKTLEDNKEGYINSAVRNVTGFNNVDFLLIHGTEDDNVHFQNSAILASKLTLKGVKYTAQYYTDNEHSMGFGNAYSQLMNLLTNFLYEHLFKK
jgi:dipeptidyl aminopeptidase/acylaminoacyl peptidase